MRTYDLHGIEPAICRDTISKSRFDGSSLPELVNEVPHHLVKHGSPDRAA
jgi:intracellular sulfur oxidation DsrE/DsrF family protein